MSLYFDHWLFENLMCKNSLEDGELMLQKCEVYSTGHCSSGMAWYISIPQSHMPERYQKKTFVNNFSLLCFVILWSLVPLFGRDWWQLSCRHSFESICVHTLRCCNPTSFLCHFELKISKFCPCEVDKQPLFQRPRHCKWHEDTTLLQAQLPPCPADGRPWHRQWCTTHKIY